MLHFLYPFIIWWMPRLTWLVLWFSVQPSLLHAEPDSFRVHTQKLSSGSYEPSALRFWWASMLVSVVAAPAYIPTRSVWMSLSPSIVSIYSMLSWWQPSDWWSHWSLIYIPLSAKDVYHFLHVFSAHLYSFWKVSIEFVCIFIGLIIC